MYVINTENNIITYSNNPLVTVKDGLNYFSGKFRYVTHLHHNVRLETGSTQSEIKIELGKIMGKCVLNHYRISVTRDSITDETAFYQYLESGPNSDKGVIIPVNMFSPTTTYEFTCLASRTADNDSENTYMFIYAWMCTCDKDYNKITTPCTVDITIDQYSL